MTLHVKIAIYNGILARYPCFFCLHCLFQFVYSLQKKTYAFLVDKKLQRNSLFKSENRSFTFINRLRFQWYRSGSITLYFLYYNEAFTLHFLYYNVALLYIFYTAKKHFLCIFTIAICAWRIT